MAETITISVKAYNELLDAMKKIQAENARVKFVLSVYKTRVMKHHQSVCDEYGAYFNKKDNAILDRMTSTMATQKMDTIL
jgi:hypothetical protein